MSENGETNEPSGFYDRREGDKLVRFTGPVSKPAGY